MFRCAPRFEPAPGARGSPAVREHSVAIARWVGRVRDSSRLTRRCQPRGRSCTGLPKGSCVDGNVRFCSARAPCFDSVREMRRTARTSPSRRDTDRRCRTSKSHAYGATRERKAGRPRCGRAPLEPPGERIDDRTRHQARRAGGEADRRDEPILLYADESALSPVMVASLTQLLTRRTKNRATLRNPATARLSLQQSRSPLHG